MAAEFAPLGFLAAFAAGLLSFLSPCVAPLVPGYLSLVSGSAMGGNDAAVQPHDASRRVLVGTLFFVAGFTLVFVVMGASASAVGELLESHRRTLNLAAGIVMILMGFFLIGAFQLPALYRERRFHLTVNRALTRSETMLLGMAFGFGWTPCIGPLLASILVYASASDTVGQGTLLLLVYSIGMAIPFLAIGFGIGRARGALRWVTRHYRVLSSIGGVTLIVLGMLFVTDRFFYFSIAAQRFYYQVVHPVTGGLLG